MSFAYIRAARRERFRAGAAPALLVKVLGALVMGVLAVPTVAIVIVLLPLFIVGALVAIFLRAARSS